MKKKIQTLTRKLTLTGKWNDWQNKLITWKDSSTIWRDFCVIVFSYAQKNSVYLHKWVNVFVCLLVCLGFIVPLENFLVIWRRQHYRWRASNFDLCLVLMAFEQWGLLSVPYLLWHGASYTHVLISKNIVYFTKFKSVVKKLKYYHYNILHSSPI